MQPPHSAATYDDIPGYGALYDGVPAYAARGDVAFYREEALRANGPVLEVGCGTGRVLLPTARSGVNITGLDGSLEMLARCRTHLAEESAETQSRVTLHQGDATAFDLHEKFALITAPFRVLQMLTTIDEQLGLVGSVARHLAPGGRFVFDVYNPRYDLLLQDRTQEQEEVPTTVLPDGRTLRRTVRVPRVRMTDQVNELELFYYVADREGATPKRYVHAFEMRWFLRAELVHLLARVGLMVTNVWGDFDRSAYADASRELIVEATAARTPGNFTA